MIAKERQTILDLALQACGGIEAAFDIAQANGCSISDDAVPGLDYETPAPCNDAVRRLYESKGVCPATAGIPGHGAEEPEEEEPGQEEE